MCGILGWIGTGATREAFAARLDRLRHRGPDGSGFWQDGARDVLLGHRRLSIIDLSPTGAQPMLDASGRWVIVFKGRNLLVSLREGPTFQRVWGTSFFDRAVRARLFAPEARAALGDDLLAPERGARALLSDVVCRALSLIMSRMIIIHDMNTRGATCSKTARRSPRHSRCWTTSLLCQWLPTADRVNCASCLRRSSLSTSTPAGRVVSWRAHVRHSGNDLERPPAGRRRRAA